LAEIKDFSVLQNDQTVSEDYLSSYSMGAGGSFPEGKAARLLSS
jgi:hypothetical protein